MKGPVKVEVDILQIMEQLGIKLEHLTDLNIGEPAVPSETGKQKVTSGSVPRE